MKTLKFRKFLADEIVAGKKTSTWRLFDDKGLSAGDLLVFIEKETGREFVEAKILSVDAKRLGDVESADFDGHEKYESKEKMLEAYRGYYGEKVDENTVVKIVRFEVMRFI